MINVTVLVVLMFLELCMIPQASGFSTQRKNPILGAPLSRCRADSVRVMTMHALSGITKYGILALFQPLRLRKHNMGSDAHVSATLLSPISVL